MHTPAPFLTAPGSPVAALMAEAHWHPTLGSAADWPTELQTLVRLMLHTPTPMFIAWGPQLRMLYNDAYLDILGVKHPAALGAPLPEIWAEIWPQIQGWFEATLAGQPQHFADQEFTLHRRGRPERTWFSFSYTPIYLGTGVAGLFCSLVETTERVLADQTAAHQQEHLHQLFMQMPGIVAVLRGPDHVFELANQPLRALYEDRTLIGRPVREALPEMVDQGFIALLDQVYTSGVPFEGKSVPAMLPSADGGPPQQRYFDFMYQPIVDAHGQVTGIFSQGLDVTEAAAATLKLRESEEWFRGMADAVPHIIWITDAQGNVEFFNRQWTEYTGDPKTCTHAQEVADRFVHPDDAQRTMERFAHAAELGVPFSVEHRIRGADGAYRWFMVRAEPLRDAASGEVVRWFGSSADISALKEAEAALQLADRRKDEFLATLAHELRNPLAPVANAVTLLRSPQVAQPVRTRMLELLDRQTRHLVRLVDDLMEVSRITQGKIELRMERVDLRTVAQASVDAAGAAIREAQHHVSLRVPAEPVWVRADPARMKQVIDNLLNNAIKYTPPGGTIELDVGQAEGRACVTVQDNGAGIPPDMLDGVFELFAQVDRTMGRSRGGLGIGLALVRQLMVLHSGEVTVTSAGINAGSTFTVRLPLMQAPPPQPTAGPGEALAPTAAPKRVLIIDDNRDAADTLASVVALCGHQAETAYDGPGGIAAAERLRPQCVLLDIGMPHMDGHQVARALRNMETTRGCLIVAVTGWGQSLDRQLTQASGFDAHLVKPASVESVLSLLEGTWG